MESNIEIFIEDEKGNSYMCECPPEITYSDLRKLIKSNDFTKLNFYHIIFKGASYDEENLNEIIKLEEGDRIIIVSDRENEGGVFVKFHKNINLNEGDINNIIPLTGILRLILIKYISSFITDVSNFSPELEKIIMELKKGMKQEEGAEKDIKTNLEETEGHNILAYSNYVASVINDDKIDFMLKQLPKNKVIEVKKFWSILSIYQEFNKHFEVELSNALERSYFDYSLVALSIYEQTNRKQYLDGMEHCPNIEVRNLFHGSQIDPISNIITNGFLYTRRPFYGVGIYFSDMLDYISFYSGGKDFKSRRKNFNSILPVNDIFTCVSAEVYYSKDKKENIFDYSLYVKDFDHFPTYEELKRDYKEKMIEKNAVNFVRVQASGGQVRTREEIINDKKKGKFIGTEYVITEMDQILPLYGLTFKRNEYIVVWRDPHFKGKNDYSDYLKERQLFIYEYAKMNVYLTGSTEEALEIIKRKKYNKIILISNIGLDLGGKKFVEVARKILGFNAPVLFFSANRKHFSWLKDFPNALYTSQESFYKDYILNYNEKGLLELKKKIESFYGIKLYFESNFLKFPNFVNQEKYDKLIFEEPSPYFKKVIIKNVQNKSVFCMDNNRKPFFNSNKKLDVRKYIWYITLIGDEITLFSNGSYLGADIKSKKVTGEEYMKTFKFSKINSNEYLLYYEDTNNVLTISGNNAILEKRKNLFWIFFVDGSQRFKFVEETESIDYKFK